MEETVSRSSRFFDPEQSETGVFAIVPPLGVASLVQQLQFFISPFQTAVVPVLHVRFGVASLVPHIPSSVSPAPADFVLSVHLVPQVTFPGIVFFSSWTDSFSCLFCDLTFRVLLTVSKVIRLNT